MLTIFWAAFSRRRCCSVFFSTAARRMGAGDASPPAACSPPASGPLSGPSPGSPSPSDSSSSPWHSSWKADSWGGREAVSRGPCGGPGREGWAGVSLPGWQAAPRGAGPAAAPASPRPSAAAARPRGPPAAGSRWGRGSGVRPQAFPGTYRPGPTPAPAAPLHPPHSQGALSTPKPPVCSVLSEDRLIPELCTQYGFVHARHRTSKSVKTGTTVGAA